MLPQLFRQEEMRPFTHDHSRERSLMKRCIAPDFLALGYTDVAAGRSVGLQAQLKMLVQPV